ncbi:HNH endonuclease [Pectobacterium brasiliense]|uniref:HNH endonuclease n=1 Tax=Pectobacterium brasiliense TaxID=180957 RepID=UPI0015DEDC4E|nr:MULTISPECIES: HNH endonuclease [Pectobacterium]MBA0219847.1 HNH endonuclease [Pectobacterium brasiliense]MBN3064980.1 HNH endonuclease [Pectobacterium aquaticum]MBN3071323.1 HNH endonuclease [Pectobacterium brasiliense]MBN3171857.1 HNH endonuclease [Pectobacterium brasiliense]
MANIRERSGSPEIEADRKKVADMESQYNELIVDSGLAAAGAAPPPFGTAADVVSLGRSLFKGDWGGAALDALGFIPILGDGAKAGKIAAKVQKVTEALSKAKAALNTKVFATTRENAKKYWKELIAKRKQEKLDKEIGKCKTEECKKLAREKFENDKSMDPGRLPSSEKGSWIGPDGKPCPPGTGMYKPDPEKNKSLYEAVKRHGKEGVPFKDGHPDFSGFPPMKDGKPIGDGGKPYRVEIDVQGNRGDRKRSNVALKEKYDKELTDHEINAGAWHHEPDGVTMTYVDKNIHHAFRDPETGTASSGTPHLGGDSMWRSKDF